MPVFPFLTGLPLVTGVPFVGGVPFFPAAVPIVTTTFLPVPAFFAGLPAVVFCPVPAVVFV